MKRVSILALYAVLLPLAAVIPRLSLAAPGNKPRIAVLAFKIKADNQWWYHGGAEAAQDVFITELVKSGKFRVVEREQLQALMQEKQVSVSGDVDPKTAVKIGKLLGVNYLLTGAVTEYGSIDVRGRFGERKFVAALNARLISAGTGEIVWADEASQQETTARMPGAD